MGLKILTAVQAKTWMTREGHKANSFTAKDMPGEIAQIRQQSKTAREIFTFVESAQTTITVVFVECAPEIINGAVFDPFSEQGPSVLMNLSVPVYFLDATEGSELVVPTGLVFLHEFGHAKQFLESPVRHAERLASDAKSFGQWGYFKATEEDNLLRHEWPVCDEMAPAFPRRSSYPRWCGLEQARDQLDQKRAQLGV